MYSKNTDAFLDSFGLLSTLIPRSSRSVTTTDEAHRGPLLRRLTAEVGDRSKANSCSEPTQRNSSLVETLSNNKSTTITVYYNNSLLQ